MKEGGRIKGVTCSYDGYIECTGMTLLSAFSDRSVLRRLIDRGDMSSLGTAISNTAFYGSGKPRVYPDARRLCEKEGTEYAYLLDDDGRWYYYRAGDDEVRDLETDLRIAYPEGFRLLRMRIGGGSTPKMFQWASTRSDQFWLFFF